MNSEYQTPPHPDPHVNINALCLVVSDKKIFPIDSYSEPVSSQAGPLIIVHVPHVE